MNTTLNTVIITGTVINEPIYHDNNGSPTEFFVIETTSREYIRTDGTRHISRIERVPIKCSGVTATIARGIVTQGCNILVSGVLQTAPMTDTQGRRRYSFYILASFLRVIS